MGVFIELFGVERLLHRRQRVPRPQRSEAPDRLERPVLAAVRERRGPGVSAGDEVLHRHAALRPRPRRRAQLRRRLPRRHRHRDVRHAGRLASDRRSDLSAARVLGPPADGDRHLQQLHHQRARQLDRDGRQHAQHPRDAEHADQLGVASDEHAAVHRRADLLHPQHRVSRAGRIDAADGRIAGRVLLQQHRS